MTTKTFIHCHIDREFQIFGKICFYISAICFFVLPVFILCILYALMAHRLYSVGLTNELRWSKSTTTESISSRMYLPQIHRCHSAFEQGTKNQRYSSSSSLSLRRSRQTSSTILSVQIQSMKKSAFKMLCKSSMTFDRTIFHFLPPRIQMCEIQNRHPRILLLSFFSSLQTFSLSISFHF